jgi:bile acid-coenzyme A ligase
MSAQPMGELVRHHAERKPEGALALIHPEGALTWRELDAAANRRANLYRSLGVKPGDFVTVGLPNGNAFCETVFAIWKLGATPNPVSASLPATEARGILDLVRPRLLVAEASDWGFGGARVSGDADLQGFDPAPPPETAPAPHWKALTSGGSTGRPKVIVARQPAVHDPAQPFMGQRADGVVLNPCPLYHNSGFLIVHMGLFTGNTVVGMRRFDAETALELIERYRVDWASFVPTMMHRIRALPEAVRSRHDLSALQSVWHGTSSMPQWLKREWLDWLGPDKIWEVYGGTEGQGATMIGGSEWLQRPGSVGRVSGEGQIRVFLEDGREANPGEVGEIYFLPPGGAGSTYHYLGAEAKQLDGGWESIGDIGWMDADGYLFLADRRTDLIIRGGANVYPAEIEGALEAHPDVASSLVVALPHEDLGQVVHAIVEPRAGRSLRVTDLDVFARGRLAKYKLPESYEISAAPLRDDAGKARRSAVRDERLRWLQDGREFRLRAETV